jgi:miniconductance mechanosensitive channel
VFERLAHLLPAMVVYYGIRWVPSLSDTLGMVIQRVTVASIVVIALSAMSAFLRAANEIYSAHPASRHRPIKGYLQIIQIAIYLLGGISVVAILMDRSPLVFLSGVGAMTAVLMLVFKDTILSLVASVQLTSNGMVAVGDWIEMPAFGADGDVIDIALHTIKVQNWDKTITTIPTHKLIDNSFKNWKGMSESGGRRIKRSLQLDMGTIRFLKPEEIEHFSHFELLSDYIREKKAALEESNRGRSDSGIIANSRYLTNIGTFRAYVVNYLRQHPKIHHQGMTFLVRQLAPTPEGVPIEVYVFSNDTNWVNYEGIQSDLFDHLLSIVPEFGLTVYQRPSGTDVREALTRTS